jgi:alpha-L-fucosidase
MVREMEPEVIFFSDAGPDIRWCGNEQGYINETNWNTITNDTIYAGKGGINDLLNTGSPDGESWIPAEVDVSIRPGWFYHSSEDDKVRTPQNLFDIYMSSVGRGSNLLLNIPPDRRGLIHENDVAALQGWKKLLDEAFANNLALNARATSETVRGNSKSYAASNLLDGDKNTYWATNDEDNTASFTINLPEAKLVKYVLLQEYIPLGQRVKSFQVETEVDGQWKQIALSTTIGYKKIVKLQEPVQAARLRVTILEAKACPLISNVELF